ncbi:MAG TPA: MFS transporter [Geodermatophilus sp.]|nr:MFS transporter [Geodermatophilus sp.]
MWRDAGDGLRLIGRTPRLRAIIGLAWVATLFVNAAEGIATPLTDELGQGATEIGVLLAANPLGVTLGGLVIARLVAPHRRERLVPALVLMSLAPVLLAGLVAMTAGPGRGAYVLVVALMFVSGLGAAWSIPLNVAFVQAVPAAFRGRAFGVAVSGLYGVQGLGVLGAGLAAEGTAPSVVVALIGGIGMVAVAPVLIAHARTQGHVAAGRPTAGPSTS